MKQLTVIDHLVSKSSFDLVLDKESTALKTTPELTESELQKYYPSIYDKIKSRDFEILSGSFSNGIQKGIETGLFRKEINIDFITRIYFNGMGGVTDINLFPLDKYKIDQLLVDFSEYHLRAICTPLGIEKLVQYKKEYNS